VRLLVTADGDQHRFPQGHGPELNPVQFCR